jgi:predicted Fe-Mo cluster-binding NifX family protein
MMEKPSSILYSKISLFSSSRINIMKLAISIAGNKLESPFDPRFGRAAAFCLVDSKTGEWRAYQNPALSASGGAGVQAAQFIAKLGAQAVVSGAYGPNAFDTLSPAGIEMYLAPTGETLTAADVLALFKAGKLSKVEAATHAAHHQGKD